MRMTFEMCSGLTVVWESTHPGEIQELVNQWNDLDGDGWIENPTNGEQVAKAHVAVLRFEEL